jgi:hypothetical protein
LGDVAIVNEYMVMTEDMSFGVLSTYLATLGRNPQKSKSLYGNLDFQFERSPVYLITGSANAND